MVWDQADRRRRGARYRLILRGSLAVLAVAGVTISAGAAFAVQSARFEMLGYGIFLASLSLLAGYLAVNRTAKIVEMDEWDREHEMAVSRGTSAVRNQHMGPRE